MFEIINENIKARETRVIRTRWMSKNANTILLTIPKQFRKKYHLDSPTDILVIPTNDGLLIKKLETDSTQ